MRSTFSKIALTSAFALSLFAARTASATCPPATFPSPALPDCTAQSNPLCTTAHYSDINCQTCTDVFNKCADDTPDASGNSCGKAVYCATTCDSGQDAESVCAPYVGSDLNDAIAVAACQTHVAANDPEDAACATTATSCPPATYPDPLLTACGPDSANPFCASTDGMYSNVECESCADIFDDCVNDPPDANGNSCAKAVYCGSQCSPTQSAITECAPVAGGGLGKALKVSNCQKHITANDPPDAMCSGAGGGGSAGMSSGSSGAGGDTGSAGADGTAGSSAGGAPAGGSSAAGAPAAGGSSAAGASAAGASAGGSTTGTAGTSAAAGTTGSTAGHATAAGSSAAGSSGAAAAAAPTSDDSGGCAVSGPSDGSSAFGIGLVLALAGLARGNNKKRS